MAAIITDTSDGQYVDPYHTVFGGVLTSTQTHEANGVVQNRDGAVLEIYPVNAITDGQTVTVGDGVIAVAFQANDVDANHTTAYLTAQSGGTVTFDVSAGTDEGWLWVLRGGGGVNS